MLKNHVIKLISIAKNNLEFSKSFSTLHCDERENMADVGSDTAGVQKTKESEQAATALDKVTDLVRYCIFFEYECYIYAFMRPFLAM